MARRSTAKNRPTAIPAIDPGGRPSSRLAAFEPPLGPLVADFDVEELMRDDEKPTELGVGVTITMLDMLDCCGGGFEIGPAIDEPPVRPNCGEKLFVEPRRISIV